MPVHVVEQRIDDPISIKDVRLPPELSVVTPTPSPITFVPEGNIQGMLSVIVPAGSNTVAPVLVPNGFVEQLPAVNPRASTTPPAVGSAANAPLILAHKSLPKKAVASMKAPEGQMLPVVHGDVELAPLTAL
jgi:hypothetical protein